MDKNYMSPEMKEFLQKECQAGDYAAMTIMVNKQHLKMFIDHLKLFQAKVAAIVNGTNAEAVLGQGKKQKLSVVQDEQDI